MLPNQLLPKTVFTYDMEKGQRHSIPKNQHMEEFNKDLRQISPRPTLFKIAEEYVMQEYVKPAVLKHIRSDQYGCVPFPSTTHALIYT